MRAPREKQTIHAHPSGLRELRPERFRQAASSPFIASSSATALTPVEAYRRIERGPSSFLFESVVGGEKIGRYSFLGADPFLRIEAFGQRRRGHARRNERAISVPPIRCAIWNGCSPNTAPSTSPGCRGFAAEPSAMPAMTSCGTANDCPTRRTTTATSRTWRSRFMTGWSSSIKSTRRSSSSRIPARSGAICAAPTTRRRPASTSCAPVGKRLDANCGSATFCRRENPSGTGSRTSPAPSSRPASPAARNTSAPETSFRLSSASGWRGRRRPARSTSIARCASSTPARSCSC